MGNNNKKLMNRRLIYFINISFILSTSLILRVFIQYRKEPWASSNAKPVKVAMPNRFFAAKRLLFLQSLRTFSQEYVKRPVRTTSMLGAVRGRRLRGLPLSRFFQEDMI